MVIVRGFWSVKCASRYANEQPSPPVPFIIDTEYRLPRLRLGDFRASVPRTAALSENLGRDERIRTSDPHTPSPKFEGFERSHMHQKNLLITASYVTI